MGVATDDVFDTKWFRGLVFAALLSGVGGGVSSLSKDDADRYRGAEARADFAIRDRRHDLLSARVSHLEIDASSHLQHSAQYTQIILELKRRFEATPHPPIRVEAMLADYEKRLRDLERHNK